MSMNLTSVRCRKELKKSPRKFSTISFQSQDRINLGQVITVATPIYCFQNRNCCINQGKFQQYVANQQNLYAEMRRFPERFPIIPSTGDINYTPQQQRAYSNNWYRQFGTSQALPANDNWGGFYVVGSEVPYTN